MEHKRISRWLLGAGAVAGTGGIFVLLAFLPELIIWKRLFLPGYVFVLIILGLCSLAVLYGLALYEYMRICIRIGKNQSFCGKNAKGLARISRYLFLAAGVWVLGQGAALLPDVGPGGWWVSFFLFAMASGAMGVLSWAIGKLLSRAVQLQEENDLTV